MRSRMALRAGRRRPWEQAPGSSPNCRDRAALVHMADRAVAGLVAPGAGSAQILLADRRPELIVVGDELADELVQAALENLVHPAVLDPRADRAGLALRRALPA